MSKYPIGRYDTGEIKYVYLRKWKFMPERFKNGLIRRKMWVASIWKEESAYNKKYKLEQYADYR